jgi:hypothetical protein
LKIKYINSKPEELAKLLLLFVAFQGQNGSHNEPRPVLPPLSNKCDWEIDPTELDFSISTIIGKVWHNNFVKLHCCTPVHFKHTH